MGGPWVNRKLTPEQLRESRRRGWEEFKLTARCTGCGTELDNRTEGCHQCNDRHYRREKRGVL